MSINLVDLVMKQVGGNLPGVLGSLLGESADKTQGALSGAVPAILGSLMGVASKGGSAADQLVSAIGDQDDGMLDDLAGMLGGGNHQAIADQGGGMLSSLLGDGVVGSLVGAVGKFSGLGGGSSKSLLGMLVPIVMSVLGRQQKNEGLDASGLMGMLVGQKDNIASAMPAGLTDALGGAGFLDNLMGSAGDAVSSIGDAASGAASAAGRTAGSVASAAGDGVNAAGRAAQGAARGASNVASQAGAAASQAAETGGSWMRWALPLVVLLAVIWLAFKFLGGSDVEEAVSDASDAAGAAVEATTEAASDAASTAVEATTEAASAAGDAASSAAEATVDAASDAAGTAGEMVSAMVGDVDVGSELTSMFGGMTDTLSGITDVESAEAAIPSLEEMSTKLDGLTGLADQLPEGAVSGISEMVDSGLSGLDGVMETLKAIPGVGDLIEPIVAQIKEKLAAFTAA